MAPLPLPLPENLQSLYNLITSYPNIHYITDTLIKIPIIRSFCDVLTTDCFSPSDYTIADDVWRKIVSVAFPFPRSYSLLYHLQFDPILWETKLLCWHYLAYTYDLVPSPLPVGEGKIQKYLF